MILDNQTLAIGSEGHEEIFWRSVPEVSEETPETAKGGAQFKSDPESIWLNMPPVG